MNGEKFQLGDSVRIQSEDSDNAFGIIRKIYTRNGGKSYIEINWYYTPEDIFTEKHAFLTEGELFTTSHLQEIDAKCIDDHINILDFNDYFGCPNVKENDYYTRAHYDSNTGTVTPAFEDW